MLIIRPHKRNPSDWLELQKQGKVVVVEKCTAAEWLGRIVEPSHVLL